MGFSLMAAPEGSLDPRRRRIPEEHTMSRPFGVARTPRLSSLPRALPAALLGLVGLGLGCDSGGGTSTATLSVMDAPPPGVTSVRVFVASMAVHVDDKAKTSSEDADDGSKKWRVLTVGREVDLVLHQGADAAEVLGQLELPEGKITQVRLTLDTEEPHTATVNGVDCELDLSKVPVQGIKIDHVFKAFDSRAGAAIEVLVDFDLEASMKEKDGCFQLEPHLKLHKVKIDGEDAEI